MELKVEYLAIFSEEASDLLREWEESLLALEKAPLDKDPLNDMFRAIHTLKGSAGFIGFDTLRRLAHDLESSLSSVRDGARKYDGTLGDLLFKGLDIARSLIDAFTDGQQPEVGVEGFLARLAEAAGSPRASGNADGATKAAKARKPSADSLSVTSPAPVPAPSAIALAPVSTEKASDEAPKAAAPSLAPSGPTRTSALVVRIEGQNREAYLRSCLVKARLDRLGTVLQMQPLPEELRESTEPFVYTVTICAAADAAELASSVSIDQVSVLPALEQIAETAEPQGRAGDAPSPTTRELQADPARTSRPEEVVRVSVQKLDTLLNLVGELVIHNSGFIATTQQLMEQHGKTALIYALEEKTEALSAVTRDLQDGIMKARMLPIASVFNRFRRVVRDLAKASGKSVLLDVFGEETEIDKKVIDRIGEPLVHLVRNAVDHGLEAVADRLAAGKPEAGTIRLGAYQDGDHICIEVSDDGRGLDRDAILRKALEKGLISAEEAPHASAEQVLGFIFLPGFSTACTVSDISGRGVGMDAVKRTVDEMNGNVRVRSAPGAGTAVTISLPLTMAIITAVLVEASGATYAVPISAVREIVKTTEANLGTVGNRRIVFLRNEVLALVNLASSLKDGRDREEALRGPTGTSCAGRPVIIVDFDGRKIGFEVDRILGSREVVIKSLSRHYREVDGLIGASILGNGKIALIVDVESMIRRHGGDMARSRNERTTVVREIASAGGSSSQSPRHAAAAPGSPLHSPRPDVQSPESPSAASRCVDSPVAPGDRLKRLAHEVAGARGRLLEEVNNQGAIQASMSLTQLTGQEIRVSFPESRFVAIRDVAEIIGGEECTVGGIYVGVRGDLSAGMLLVIPGKNLLVLDDLLHGRTAGTSRELSAMDLSGISEMGNILASCFINAIADAARLTLHPEAPEISVDMCLPVIDSVIARFNQPGDNLLLIEAVIFVSGAENMACHQILFLEPDSLRRLMDALAACAAPAVSVPSPLAAR